MVKGVRVEVVCGDGARRTPIDMVDFGPGIGVQIAEGNHRIAALKLLGYKSFPAVVYVDLT